MAIKRNLREKEKKTFEKTIVLFNRIICSTGTEETLDDENDGDDERMRVEL